MTLHSLPLFVRVAGRPVILLGDGEAADAKRRFLDRAGAIVTSDETAQAALAIVAIENEAAALAAVARLRARGVLVNAVDRPAQCDFTLPAIVDRAPVIVAIGTGGASAGLAAALRQRLEAILPAGLGDLAEALHAMRDRLRARFPDAGERRRALGRALASGGPLDPLRGSHDPAAWLASGEVAVGARHVHLALGSPDPDDLTLAQARSLAQADRVLHRDDVPPAILDRARADAMRERWIGDAVIATEGLTVTVEMTA